MTIQKPESRARNVALVGLTFQILLSVFLIVLGAYSESQAVQALWRLTVAGVPIWLVLVLIYHQRKLVQEESFETEQLRRERDRGIGGEALFGVEGEQLLLARRRLRWMYRWMLPVFTCIVVVGLGAMALFGWSWGLGEPFLSDKWPAIKNLEDSLLIWFIGGIAFLSFLFSRYAIGMARHRDWQMLRAGASYLMGVTLAAVATAAVLAVVHFSKGDSIVPEHVLAFALRILMLVLAAEFLLNFILDFYRPRSPEEEPRPSFDSRLLGLFSEPGGIARSIADAINYQFGFDVSSTWFYKLLQRSVVPLIGFAVVTLFLASCLVFVNAGEVAVVERFGQRKDNGSAQAGQVARASYELGPGLHVKWPWPIDVAHKVAVEQVHELKIGLDEQAPDAKQPEGAADELILWTTQHSQEPHLMVLVATPKLASYLSGSETQPAASTQPALAVAPESTPRLPGRAEAVPVSILLVAATIQYKIGDAWHWLTQYEEPEKVLESIANREIMRYCASAEVMGLLGQERRRIEKTIHDAIQSSADDIKLGVEVVFFGLQGVHPPETTAEDFQKVVGAEQEKVATINTAKAEYEKKLTEVAGDVGRAEQLKAAIERMNRIETNASASPQEKGAARDQVDRLFLGRADLGVLPIGGQAAIRVAEARTRRWRLENEARAQAIAFEQAMATKNAAPRVFQMRKYLETLASSMSKARKYIIAAEGSYDLPIFQLNFQDAQSPSLDLGEQQP